MAKKILITSGKGGVGKSTVTAALGKIFAHNGLRTLMIDCDAGLSSLDIMFGCRESASFSWYDAFMDRCSPEDSIIPIKEHLYLMCSPQEKPDAPSADCVNTVAEKIQNEYDIILIDSPAGIGRGLERAAKAAEFALIVATADEVSVSAAEKIDNEIRKYGIKQSRLLINRYEIKSAKKGKLLTIDDIIDKTLVQLIGIIPEDKEIVYSTVTKKISKKSKSSKAFRRIADRINGKNVELILRELK